MSDILAPIQRIGETQTKKQTFLDNPNNIPNVCDCVNFVSRVTTVYLYNKIKYLKPFEISLFYFQWG